MTDTPEIDLDYELVSDHYDRKDVPALKPHSPVLMWLGYGLLLLLGAALLIAIWSPDDAPKKKTKDRHAPQIDVNVPALSMPKFEKPAPAPVLDLIAPAHAAPRQSVESLEPPPNAALNIPPPATQSLSGNGMNASNDEEDPYTRRLKAPLSGQEAGGASSAPLSNGVSARPASTASSTVAPSTSDGVDLSSTGTAPVRASRIADLTFTIPKGTFANCVMTTAIQTDQPGFAECRLMRDIYGADGTVILLDKGSTVSGEYKPGSFEIGKERIAIVWNRVRTPTGVIANIGSPGTGPLGRGGVGGWVDHHYGLRYGIPILISLIEQGAQFANAAVGNGGNQNQAFTTTTNAVTQVLSENAQIAPTLYKNQGELVSIIFADDVDFSTVYQLSRR